MRVRHDEVKKAGGDGCLAPAPGLGLAHGCHPAASRAGGGSVSGASRTSAVARAVEPALHGLGHIGGRGESMCMMMDCRTSSDGTATKPAHRTPHSPHPEGDGDEDDEGVEGQRLAHQVREDQLVGGDVDGCVERDRQHDADRCREWVPRPTANRIASMIACPI